MDDCLKSKRETINKGRFRARPISAFVYIFALANHNAGNEKFTPRRARKYCRLLGLPRDSILTF